MGEARIFKGGKKRQLKVLHVTVQLILDCLESLGSHLEAQRH